MTVAGRSQNGYVSKVTRGWTERIHLNSPVSAVRYIEKDGEQTVEVTVNGNTNTFDYVIFSTHAPDTVRILGDDISGAELNILSAFEYQDNEVFLHRDRALMPKNESCWASWNFLGESRKSAAQQCPYLQQQQQQQEKEFSKESYSKSSSNNGHSVIKEDDLHSNGYTNGYGNGHSNGHSNGHTNGQTNGHSNGHTNGHNGKSNGNGHIDLNGASSFHQTHKYVQQTSSRVSLTYWLNRLQNLGDTGLPILVTLNPIDEPSPQSRC